MRHLGVLFVHGIGSQTQGRTLVDWGQSLVAWVNRWTQTSPQAPPVATIRDALLVPRDTSPAHAFVDVRLPGVSEPVTTVLAEAWWASTVLRPSFSELARWAFVIVPSTIASHFMIRMRRHRTTKQSEIKQFLLLLGSLFSLAVAMIAMPFLILGLALILFLGLIPISRVQELAGAVQRALANTLGDSLALLGNAVQAAAIVGGVRRDLEWLSVECEKVVVIAHSQGAAVAHLALEQTTAKNVTLFITFGSGIAKLVETRRLMRDLAGQRWAPWFLSLGAILISVGLWRSLPGLWALLDARALWYVLAYVVCMGLASLPRIPFLLRAGFFALTVIPIVLFWWAWFNHSEVWLFVMLGGYVLFGAGLQNAEEREDSAVDGGVNPQRLDSVEGWLDLYGSRDPVANGPLFGTKSGRNVRSREVMVLRSIFSDHTAYWTSVEDFVPRVVGRLVKEAGIGIGNFRSPAYARVRRSRIRRRWRTAFLGFIRTAMLVAPLVILATRGISVAPQRWQPTEQIATTPIGISIQNSATELVVDVAGTLTPDIIKRWIGKSTTDSPPTEISTGAASLTLLVLLTWLAFRLILWRWRAWDRAEIERFFERQPYQVLEPQFVVFLFVAALVFEVVVFVTLGWGASLRTASTPLLRLILTNTGIFIILATLPWLLKFLWLLVRSRVPEASETFVRGLGAAVVAVLAVMPVFVHVAATLVEHDPGTLENSNLIEPAGWAIAVILVAVWVVPLFKLWSRVEGRVSGWTGSR
jgi:hypothetical protein